MRKFVSVLVLLVMSAVWLVPASAMIRADTSQTLLPQAAASSSADDMSCCVGDGAGHQSKRVNCATDCHFLAPFAPMQFAGALPVDSIAVAGDLVASVSYTLFRPPISL